MKILIFRELNRENLDIKTH